MRRASSSRERGSGRTTDEDAAAAAKYRALHEKGIIFSLDLPSLHSGWSARMKEARERQRKSL
jgi:hypothetical protein